MGAIPAGASVLQALPIVAAATAAGAVVDAIHGLVLVWVVLRTLRGPRIDHTGRPVARHDGGSEDGT